MAPPSGGGAWSKFESGVTGAPIRREVPENFFCRAPPLFRALKVVSSRFGERFRDGQYSLVSFSFAVILLTVLPHAQPFVKVEGTCPRAL